MADPHFAHTLTYVCEHNAGRRARHRGQQADRHDAVGAVRADRRAARRRRRCASRRCIFGGPVQIDRGFVLHRPLGNWQSTLAISDDIGLTTSKDVLEAVARGEGPQTPARVARATPAGRRASSSRSSRRTRGSPSRPTPTWCSTCRPNGGCPRRCGCSASILAAVRRRRARVIGSDRPAAPETTVLAFDFGTRRIGVAVGNTLTRVAQPLATIDDEASTRRFAAIAALVGEWQPRHAGRRHSRACGRHGARDDRAGTSLRAAARTDASACPWSRRTSASRRRTRRPRSTQCGRGGRRGARGARRDRRAAHPARMVR